MKSHMTKRKSRLIAYFIIFFTIMDLCLNVPILYSQSLSVDETLSYINNLLNKYPETTLQHKNTFGGRSHCKTKMIYNYSIEKTGNLNYTGHFYIYNCPPYSWETLGGTRYEYFKDTLEISHSTKFNINDLIYTSLKKTQGYGNHAIGMEIYDRWSVRYNFSGTSTMDNYTNEKFINAFIYLFSLLEQSNDYKRDDLSDPFSPTNFNTKNQVSNLPSNKNTTNSCNVFLSESNGVFHVPIKLGTQNGLFVLDSGAGEVNISSEFEQSLRANGIIKDEDYLNSGLYKLADGSIQSCRRVLLRSMVICNFKVKNVTASIGGTMLLGKSFFDKFKRWSIDNNKSTLYLEKY
jgi:hypothetical protein